VVEGLMEFTKLLHLSKSMRMLNTWRTLRAESEHVREALPRQDLTWHQNHFPVILF
jgi:hypothetical protein